MGLPKLPQEYSLSMVRSDGDRSRVFLRADRSRVEFDSTNGHSVVVIARGDLGVAWQSQNAGPWVETSLDPRIFSADVDPSNFFVWKEAGAVELEGHQCTHYHGFLDNLDGTMVEECFVLPSGIRRRTVTYRTDGGVGIVINCLDVKLGPPPLELFELPPETHELRMGSRNNKRRGPNLH